MVLPDKHCPPVIHSPLLESLLALLCALRVNEKVDKLGNEDATVSVAFSIPSAALRAASDTMARTWTTRN